MKNFKHKSRYQFGHRGFSLMEVLIGILVFAVGMLALASLQGALTRSSAEAKVRTTAINIAEQIIEQQKGFNAISSFQSIVDIPLATAIKFDSEMTRITDTTPVGMVYTVTQDVTDYYYDLASDGDTTIKNAFTSTAPTGITIPDFKTVLVTVSWDDNRDYVIDEDSTAGDLGGGSVQVSATISNVSVTSALKVVQESDDDIIAPSIVYTPGENPDIVSLGLGGDKFKESLTPEPKVYRDNLESRFDVITYSTGTGDAVFLRREEFVAVSCDCTLESGNGDGKSPAIWAGDEYSEPATVSKAYGTASGRNNAQSPLCDACCRDHHDGDGSALYDPSRPDGEYSDGNHKHYYRQGGDFVEAQAGDDYLEACRFVRKDGFFRLTQDFRLEGLNTFAGDYLITTNQVEDYSGYVINEVYGAADSNGEIIPVYSSYVPKAIAEGLDTDGNYHKSNNPPTVETAPRTASPAEMVAGGDLTFGYTNLPTSTNATFQQLRGRSIYIDHLSVDLQAVIKCLMDASTDADKLACKKIEGNSIELDKIDGTPNALEIIPFFELQTTYLNDWEKGVDQNYFTLTNDTVTSSDANGPTHSRGKVENQDGGTDMVKTIANRGVTGLTASDPISLFNKTYRLPEPASGWKPGQIEVISGEDETTVDGRRITISLSSEVGGLQAANVGFSTSNAICSYVTSSGVFTCFIPADYTDESSLTISDFDKPPKEIRLCSSHQFGKPEIVAVSNYTSPGAPKTVDLTNAVSDPEYPYLLYLTDETCPGDGGIIF